jgi:nucleotide-binding universal stress UspA family protein
MEYMWSAAPATEVGLNRVLVATDFSEASEKALHHAVVVARHYGAKLYLAHVVSSLGFTLAGADAIAHAEEATWRDLRRLERRLVETGALTGVPHEAVVRGGEVWEQLQQIIEQENIDLIVVGTHGRTGLRKIVLGSVAEGVFRHSSCPVLTVGPCAPSGPPANGTLRHILYTTDLSADSAQAAPYALSAATKHGARLTVLHVVDPLCAETAEERERVISALEIRLREFLPPGPEVPYNLNFRIETGPTEKTILKIAGHMNADLIVLGLRSPDTFVDHLVWLSAYRIVCEACCPVLTVRSRRRPRL